MWRQDFELVTWKKNDEKRWCEKRRSILWLAAEEHFNICTIKRELWGQNDSLDDSAPLQ